MRCIPDGIEQLCKVVEVQKNTKVLFPCFLSSFFSILFYTKYKVLRLELIQFSFPLQGLVATEDLYKDQFLIKFKGKMMFGPEFDEENPMFRRYVHYITTENCGKM